MISVVCSKCNLALRTNGEHGELDHLIGPKSDWWPDRYPCPRCGHARAEYFDSISAMAHRVVETRDLTPQEMFSAFHGLGLPEEQECGPTALREALQHPVKAVDCELLGGTTRSILRSLEMEDGTRVYLGSSPAGAVVYRIAKKRSYTEEALHEQG